MTKLLLPMNELPGVIRESLRRVLMERKLSLPEEVLRESGNNIAAALFSIDEGGRLELLHEWALSLLVRVDEGPLRIGERAALLCVLKILDGSFKREDLFDEDDLGHLDNTDSDAPRQS